MHRYRDLRRSPGAAQSSCCVFCEFLKQGRKSSVVGPKCILCLNGLLTTYNIIFFHLHSSSVDRVDLLLYDKLLVYEAIIHHTHFLWYCFEGCSYLQQKMFLWRITKSFFNGNSVRETLWSLFIQMLAGLPGRQ